MKKEIFIFLQHILESIEKIQLFVGNISFQEFEKDEKTHDAAIRRIEIIGEAVKNLPKDFTKKFPEVPWKEIAGTRDKLTHHYFGVDLYSVWKTIIHDLPVLKDKIQEIKDLYLEN